MYGAERIANFEVSIKYAIGRDVPVKLLYVLSLCRWEDGLPAMKHILTWGMAPGDCAAKFCIVFFLTCWLAVCNQH